MNNTAAYILTITSIAERLSDANTLQHSLNSGQFFNAVEIIPSIYWKEESSAIAFLNEFPEHTFTDRYLDTCRKGQICCTLSHINIWRKLLNSDHDGAFVFEDDIYLEDPEHLKEIIASLSMHKEIDWLRIHLHKSFRDEILQSRADSIFMDDPSIYGFAVYYISRQGAKKLLSHFQYIDDNIDRIIPILGKTKALNCKTIHQVIVEHHPFVGTEDDLMQRHEIERKSEKLQKSPSTIYASPYLKKDEEFYKFNSARYHARQLNTQGYTVLKGVFEKVSIARSRDQVLAHRELFKNTRPTPSSLHLAGFHRFPELEALHTALATNETILDFLKTTLKGRPVRTIGLSDITINRSQDWHKDLLRGKYRCHLDDKVGYWDLDSGGIYKALLYLQDGASLKILSGSHLKRIPLDSDTFSVPDETSRVTAVPVEAGDVVIMDIRVSHRGSPEEAFQSDECKNNPRILISTVLGRSDSALTKAMEIGNFHRLMDWVERNP